MPLSYPPTGLYDHGDVLGGKFLTGDGIGAASGEQEELMRIVTNLDIAQVGAGLTGE